MSGLFVAAWRLVLKRATADRLIVGAAFVTVLLAITLLAAGPVYSESVALSGLRRALADAPAQERGVEVSARISADEYRAASRRAVQTIASTLGGSSVLRSGLSDSFTLPPGRARSENKLAVFAFYEGIGAHARLLAGRWPRAEAGAVQAVLPATAARDLGLELGDGVVLAATGDPTRTVAVTLVGTYRIAVADDVFWWASPLETEGRERVNFTTHGTFVVPEASLFATAAPEVNARWRAALAIDRLALGDVAGLREWLDSLDERLQAGAAANYSVAGGLGRGTASWPPSMRSSWA
jgi:hypothetical protein